MTQPPLQITFRHMDPSPALETRIQELASHLTRHSSHIQRLRVVIDAPSAHHRNAPFDVTLEITVPGEEIAIRTEGKDEPTHQDPYTAVGDAFKAAARRLDDHEAKRHQDVKSHTLPK